MAEESNQMGRHLSKMSAANAKRLRDELRLRESLRRTLDYSCSNVSEIKNSDKNSDKKQDNHFIF